MYGAKIRHRWPLVEKRQYNKYNKSILETSLAVAIGCRTQIY